MTAVTDRAADHAPEPAVTAEQGCAPRFVPVRVNLLPDEIAAGRRTDIVRRRVIIGIAALVAVLVGAYGGSWWQTHSAQNGLDEARRAQTALQQQTGRYAPLVTDKAATATIQNRLRQLMATDVTWSDLLATLRRTAPAGVAITQVDATVTGASSTAQTDPLDTSGLQQIGSLALTGTARDKDRVADFADALAKVTGFGTPAITSVTKADGGSIWQMTVPVTAEALSGRYQSKGGK